MMKNFNALNDIYTFIKKIKWYWLVPIVGYFLYTYDLHKFMQSKNVVITNKKDQNPKYIYVFFKLTARGTSEIAEDVQAYTNWILKIYSYTLFLLFSIVILISIVINIQLLLSILLIPIFIKRKSKN